MPIKCHKWIILFFCMMLMGLPAVGSNQSPAIRQWAAPEARRNKLQGSPRRVSSDLVRIQKRQKEGVSSASGVSEQKDPMEEWIRHVEGLPELEISLETTDPEKVKQAEAYLAGIGMTITYVSEKYGRIYGTLDYGQMDAAENTPYLSFVYPSYLPITRSGTVASEGDAAMATEVIRNQYGLTGAGITVGIISDSMDHDQDSLDIYIAAGELPGPETRTATPHRWKFWQMTPAIIKSMRGAPWRKLSMTWHRRRSWPFMPPFLAGEPDWPMPSQT